ncbi:unnamed protein product, partial [Urochloa humidicola]
TAPHRIAGPWPERWRLVGIARRTRRRANPWPVGMRGGGPPTEALATRPCRLQRREVGIVLFLLPECGKLMVVECKKRNITNTVKMEGVETEQLLLMMKTVS